MSFDLSHLYGQRDSRWQGKKLGNSYSLDGTIGNKGCALTAITNLNNMLFGTNLTPDEVNDLFTVNQCYSKDAAGYSIVNWTRVFLVFPHLKFVFRDWNYSNLLVFKWINISPRLPVIVAVRPKFTPNHFVVFIGGQKMVDSLDGVIKPTSTYPALTGSVRFTKV